MTCHRMPCDQVPHHHVPRHQLKTLCEISIVQQPLSIHATIETGMDPCKQSLSDTISSDILSV